MAKEKLNWEPAVKIEDGLNLTVEYFKINSQEVFSAIFILLAIILRLINIDKPEGLWNDEYVSWFVASTPFIKGFWQEVLKQCHMPLYYLYLKPFTTCSDVVMRITSVIPSVISVYVMYLTGKEFFKKTAVYAGLLTSVLSFLVYYAQEVRFYSLLFLFSALLLLFTENSK